MVHNKVPLPFFLGSTKSDVHQTFGGAGHVDGLGMFRDSYPRYGVAVEYEQPDLVRTIRLVVATDPGSKLHATLGVSVGDGAETYLSLFGPPFKTVVHSWARLLVWKDNGIWITLTTWLENGNEEPWGAHNEGDIQEIEVSTNPPYCCCFDGDLEVIG